ncbi:hypothetical protein [Vagococcus fluvialis]|uniref:hypothetical protein n=1 Tax=Vagococcus fluvialis TaxID=2738 RepID=UPI0037B91327
MTPRTITYLMSIVTFGYLFFEVKMYQNNKKNGESYVVKIISLTAAIIVLILSLYSIFTGQSYQELVDKISIR